MELLFVILFVNASLVFALWMSSKTRPSTFEILPEETDSIVPAAILPLIPSSADEPTIQLPRIP